LTQLRAQEPSVSFGVGSGDDIRWKNGVSALAFFSSDERPALSSAVALAVQDSPALQAGDFETINAWILNVCSGGRADSDSAVQSLDVAVQLAVVVFQKCAC
jgi:hypothetical protein